MWCAKLVFVGYTWTLSGFMCSYRDRHPPPHLLGPFCFLVCATPMFLSQIINNYVEGTQTGARDKASPSGLHFRDSKRKVDYVLAYHYRKCLARHVPGAASPEPRRRSASMALVSNGSTGKGRAEPQQQQQQDDGQRALQEWPGLPGLEVVELSPLDTLEEERRLQREEYECNLLEAGLEIEKDPEVRGGDLHLIHGIGCPDG